MLMTHHWNHDIYYHHGKGYWIIAIIYRSSSLCSSFRPSRLVLNNNPKISMSSVLIPLVLMVFYGFINNIYKYRWPMENIITLLSFTSFFLPVYLYKIPMILCFNSKYLFFFFHWLHLFISLTVSYLHSPPNHGVLLLNTSLCLLFMIHVLPNSF